MVIFLYISVVVQSKTKGITRLVRPSVRRLTAYRVNETRARIKLDAMENPFPLPEAVRSEIADAAKDALINRYPDPSARALKTSISEMWGIPAQWMMLGNGSDELIQAVVLAFGGPVVSPVPSFAMYGITAAALSQKFVAVPLQRDFSLNPDAVIKKAREVCAKVIFLACPNNPTGNRFSDDAVSMILNKSGASVVIDEAYYSFSGRTWLSELPHHRNMIILRTLSKIGLAGLRIGILAAAEDVVEELNKVRLPYNINTLSQAAASIVLRHRDILDSQISLLISERERLYNGLSAIPGVKVYRSETNFILIRTDKDATAIYKRLKEAGILIKDLNSPGLLRNCLRITVGTPAENDEFLSAFRTISAEA